MRYLVWFAVLALPLRGQGLSEADAAALIEKARAEALRYSETLPDFLCTQTVDRYADPRGDNRWQKLDVLTVKLSFSGHHEDYKLTAIDGKPTDLDYMSAGGPTSKGEFGSLLMQVFDPQTQAAFHWKGWSSVRRQRTAVFTYRVDQKHSQYLVSYGAVESSVDGVVAGFHGEVAVEPESGRVLRITQRAELPPRFPITEANATVEYGYAAVGEQRYLLPAHADTVIQAGKYRTENRTDFTSYRKFQAETTITFDK